MKVTETPRPARATAEANRVGGAAKSVGALQNVKPSTAEGWLRGAMMLLSFMAFATTLTELGLENHMKGTLQLIPWALCGLGCLALAAAALRPTPQSLTALRVAMAIVALGGFIGIGVHLKENLDFQHEIHPSAAAGTYIVAALKGAAPLLAPGALIFAALLALVATYGHPLLRRGPDERNI